MGLNQKRETRMKAFEWSTPSTVDEAVKLLAEASADEPERIGTSDVGRAGFADTMKERILFQAGGESQNDSRSGRD